MSYLRGSVTIEKGGYADSMVTTMILPALVEGKSAEEMRDGDNWRIGLGAEARQVPGAWIEGHGTGSAWDGPSPDS